MKRSSIVGFIAIFLFLGSWPALAQDRGQVGATMGYPTSLGLVWHPTDRVGIRPEFSISKSSSQQEVSVSPIISETDATLYSVGVSALLYLRRGNTLSTYVSPRLMYGRSSTTIDNSITGSSESETNTTTFSGSFGAQYALSRRFSVFGEVGLAGSWSSSRTEIGIGGDVEVDGTSWGTRSGVGVIFYFK